MTAAAIADLLAGSLPDAIVLTDGDVDGFAVSGIRPEAVVRVNSPEQVARLLGLAAQHGWATSPRGGGTMLDLGNPIGRLDVVVELSRMNAVVDYQPDDLTVTVQSGITVGALQRLLEERGQALPLDVPLPDAATIGGALATNASGPRRLRSGTARDLVIGMQAALPGIGLARSGGRVVKNVAGYDLAKLHVGGLGTTGVITEVTFKLSPTPVAGAALLASFESCESAYAAAMEIIRGQLFPAAVELLNPSTSERLVRGMLPAATGQWTVAVLMLGVPDAVHRQTQDIAALGVRMGSPLVAPLDAVQRVHLFDGIRDYGRAASSVANLILRASVLPSQTARAVDLLSSHTASPLGQPEIIARPGTGTVLAHWSSAPAEAIAGAVSRTRERLTLIGGGLLVERAPVEASGAFDAWGIEGPDLALMRRLKETYDPRRILNPGRYVGGL